MTESLPTLVLMPLIAALSPVLGRIIGRWLPVPLVVFEIMLGLLLGPAAIGWIHDNDVTSSLSELGLAMLFFLAGYEIEFQRLRGVALRVGVLGWLFSLGLGVVLGVLLAPTATAGVFVGCALATTALGTLMPVLRDTGSLDTPFGVRVLAVGAAGEFGPIVAIALFLSGRDPGRATFVLLAFVALAGFALRMAVRGDHPRMHRLIVETLHSSGQFAVRLVVLVLACMVALAVWLGLDMLLGAFTAGVLVRLLFSGQDKAREDAVESKLEALGFGFLVPLFFVHTGVTYNLHALLHSTAALIMLPVFALLFLLVRGLPAAWAAPDGSSRKDRAALALYGATALPLVVAITDIGVSNGQLKVATASAMVGAGMLSVLLCPIFAMRLHTERAVTDLPVGSLVHESW